MSLSLARSMIASGFVNSFVSVRDLLIGYIYIQALVPSPETTQIG
jgi:hypothetical protein